MDSLETLKNAKAFLLQAVECLLKDGKFDESVVVIRALQPIHNLIGEVASGEIMGLTLKERQLIHGGLLIDAIKALRNRKTIDNVITVGLKEAKDIVEAYRDTLVEVRDADGNRTEYQNR